MKNKNQTNKDPQKHKHTVKIPAAPGGLAEQVTYKGKGQLVQTPSDFSATTRNTWRQEYQKSKGYIFWNLSHPRLLYIA